MSLLLLVTMYLLTSDINNERHTFVNKNIALYAKTCFIPYTEYLINNPNVIRCYPEMND